MALSDLAVFSEWAYSGFQETLGYNVTLFNAASDGTIVLRQQSHTGDYSEEAFWKRIDNLVRRRNAYGNATLSEVSLEMLTDVMVKVAGGTPPVNVSPSQFEWIRRNPEEGGALYGRQLAGDMVRDMVETGIMAFIAATIAEDAVYFDGADEFLNWKHFNQGQALFGDRSAAIRVWIMHSAPLFGLWGSNLVNAEQLFDFGGIRVVADPFGRPLVITDSPSLVELNGVEPDTYYTLGLTTAAIVVDQNDDFHSNVEESNGKENIQRTIQSEWSFNLGLKGYAWDKTNGGKSPNDAALAVSTNWDRIATSHKDLGGVIIETQAGDPSGVNA